VLCILIAAALESVSWVVAGPILAVTSGLIVAVALQILPVLPRLVEEGWTRTSLASQPWHWVAGIVVALVVWWIGRSGRKTIALLAASAVLLVGLLLVKFSPIASDVDRFASARALSKTAPKDGCVHPADRDLRYGLSYYWGFEVPMCNDETISRRIFKHAP
jgi:hypothetical protein